MELSIKHAMSLFQISHAYICSTTVGIFGMCFVCQKKKAKKRKKNLKCHLYFWGTKMHIIKTQTKNLKRMCICRSERHHHRSKYAFQWLNGLCEAAKCINMRCYWIAHVQNEINTMNEKKRKKRRKRFVYFFRSFAFYKRLIILNVNAPPIESNVEGRETESEKWTEQKECTKNGSIIFYLACAHAHSFSSQPLISKVALSLSLSLSSSSCQEKRSRKKVENEKKRIFRHIRPGRIE